MHYTPACLPALKPLLSLAIKGTLKSSSGASKPASGNIDSAYGPRSKKPSVTISGFRSDTRQTMHKSATTYDDDRPFVRLGEADSVNGGDQGLELQELSRDADRGVVVTTQFGVGDDRV